MPRFELGHLVATPNALRALRESGHAASEFLRRHAAGDWGEVDGHDFKQNQIALREGGRLLSSYQTRKGETLWIITEADHSATTILLPCDY
jgi:hypothetical protein